MHYPKKTGFNLYQLRHCAYITYSFKTWFLKRSLYVNVVEPSCKHFLPQFIFTNVCPILSVVCVFPFSITGPHKYGEAISRSTVWLIWLPFCEFERRSVCPFPHPWLFPSLSITPYPEVGCEVLGYSIFKSQTVNKSVLCF